MSTNAEPLTNGQQEPTETTSEADLQASETSANSPETPQQPLSEAEKAEAVADLLAGAESPEPEPDPQEPSAEPPKPSEPPRTVQAAAEALGIEASELYKLEITTGDGETVTLGDLKDAHQGRAAAERETVERAAALDERETALIAEQRVWAEMGESLSQALTPEKRQQLISHLEERDRMERSRMVQAMPEMADQAKFDQFRNDAVELLGAYGYKPHEIVVGDHRQLMVIRDLIRAKQRLKQLKEFKPTQAPPAAKKAQGRTPAPDATSRAISKARNSRHEADKVAGVAALLKG